jgi:hypothetical protein
MRKLLHGDEGGEFPIKKPTDEEEFSLLVKRDKERFLTARGGDHIMCLFQCDLCHFRNTIEGSQA